ncbi:LuxR C-terminal-related transcriptional regulator [Paenibacillus sp. sgz500992]|uniref:LuxR C-terminal-related transcriptional regulator n=1 Tax=Paenibacillus sp. sgz500992 TaxID=3242476 RepID=UPI0036D3DEDB
MSIFDKTRVWCLPGDLKEEQLKSFQPVAKQEGAIPAELTAVSSNEKCKDRIYHTAMIASIRNEMKKISHFISIPYVVFLTGKEGVILELVSSSPDLQADMLQAGMGVGVSLEGQYSGLNAVSLAMEMNCIGVVRGEEHSNIVFKGWNCVCAPLQRDGKVYGYVDISFNKNEQIEFAIPFVQQVAENISEKWMEQHPEMQQYRLEASFQEFRLTAREQDVSRLWLMEKSALHIANELGISEGTVRNMVKNIYSKMRVNDRWQFTKKLAH